MAEQLRDGSAFYVGAFIHVTGIRYTGIRSSAYITYERTKKNEWENMIWNYANIRARVKHGSSK